MEVIGFDSEAAQQQVTVALLGLILIFTFIAPIGGLVIHRLIRPFVPADEVIVLLGTAFIIFIMSFALILGILFRVPLFAGLPIPLVFLISVFGGGVVTAITAVVVRTMIRRGASRLDPDAHSFGVWGEDARQHRKNLRRK